MRISWGILSLSSCVLVLSGCSGMPGMNSTGTVSNPVSGVAIQGKVHGGQQPISGASVYLYAANTAGYGAASISLLKSSGSNTHSDGSGNYYVTTDSEGNFAITGDYTCPSTASQVYLYSVGGNPGSGANSAVGLLAALGACPASGTLSQSLFVSMDEVSTVATAYALAGYAVDATHFSSSGSTLATTGITNAFAAVANLETVGTGLALTSTPAGNGTVPQSEINTLANILAACINSTGPDFTPCTTLFANAMSGAVTPGNTATAALNIAHNPGANVANLFALQTAASPFQPMLSAAPNDWTISLLFTGGGMTQPGQLAIDASGNVWVGNVTTLSEFNPLGAPLSSSLGFTGSVNSPSGLAVDTSGNVWVADYGTSSISKFNSSGSEVSGSPFSGGGLNGSYGIAFDKSGNVWVGNYSANTVSEFTSTGSPITGSAGYTFTGLTQPDSVAVDISDNVWVNGYGGGVLAEFNSSGTALAGSSAYSGSFAGLFDGYTVAIDAVGNLWVPNVDYGTLIEFEPGTGYLSPSGGYFGAGLYDPLELAIDGSGNVWLANFDSLLTNTPIPGSISEFSPSGAAITGNDGYISNWTNQTNGIAIDGSGNIWVPSVGNNGLVEFVGAASPIVTPTVSNLLSPYGSHAVNLP
jgi:streptogramin lyase